MAIQSFCRPREERAKMDFAMSVLVVTTCQLHLMQLCTIIRMMMAQQILIFSMGCVLWVNLFALSAHSGKNSVTRRRVTQKEKNDILFPRDVTNVASRGNNFYVARGTICICAFPSTLPYFTFFFTFSELNSQR